MSEPKKNHLNIDGGQIKEDDHVASYKPIPESDTDFRTSKSSIHKSKEVSSDGAEEKLLDKEEEAKIITRVDMADAKYVVGDHRNGDAKIELDANKRQFTGLTKEELMKYAEDPFWVRLRWFMFVLFWALWLCMLGGAIVIIVRAPKCPLPPPRTWYEKGPLVDMSSLDSYGDIEPELPLLQQAQVAAIFTHTCKDAYEVLEDKSTCINQFKEFLVKAKEYGVKVIVDLTANYVPSSHRWFQLSENRSEQFDKYFTWVGVREYEDDGSTAGPTPKPPNNWVSTLNAPAWSFSEKRNEFYLHQFGEDQPDLNFRNEAVVKHFDDVIKTWMAAGASGIRLRHAREMLVSTSLLNETAAGGRGRVGATHDQYGFWRHNHTSDQPELAGLLAHWAHLAAGDTNDTVFTTLEEEGRKELFLERRELGLRPYSTRPVAVTSGAAAADIRERLKLWPAMQLTSPEGAGEDLAAFALLLPAAPVLTLDQLGDYRNHTDSHSMRQLSALRQDYVVEHGQYEVTAVPARLDTDEPTDVLACIRYKTGRLGYAAVYNPGERAATANLTSLGALPSALAVHHATAAVRERTNYTENAMVRAEGVAVPARATLVLSFTQRPAPDS